MHNKFLISVTVKSPEFAAFNEGSSVVQLTSADLANSPGLCNGLLGSERSFAGYFPLLPSLWLEADCSANFPGPTKHIGLHVVAYIFSDLLLNLSTGCCVVPARQMEERQNAPKDPRMRVRIENSFSHPFVFWVPQ